MKLTVDLPDWCDERNVYIMAGIELAGYKLYGRNEVMVKSVRCNMCGECCMNLPKRYPVDKTEDGKCIHFDTKTKLCLIPIERSRLCDRCDPNMNSEPKEYCAIRYKVGGSTE